jgi:hypothetical protein
VISSYFSVPFGALSTAVLVLVASTPDQAETMAALADKFAPALLHPSDEPNLPANVDWFVPNTTFSFYNAACPQDDINFGQSSFNLMQNARVTSTCGGHIYTASGTRSADRRRTFILSDVADPLKAGLSDPAQWVTYYHAYDNDLGGKTIQYWSFYPFNTGVKIGPIEVGYHGGDWEMVAVMLDESGQPAGAFMTGHKNIDFLPWNVVEKRDGHPVFYTERGGHEAHTAPQEPEPYMVHPTWSGGKGSLPGQPPRQVGPLIALGSRLQPQVGFLSYSGLWGSLGATSISSGYWGPAFNETGMPADSFLAAWCYRISDRSEANGARRECYPDDIQ